MSYQLSKKDFFHLTSFILLYFSIYTQPKNIIEIVKNPITISIIPYIVFTTQSFCFLKYFSNNIFYLKKNIQILLIIFLFFGQCIGLLNAFINNKYIFNFNNLEAVYYLISAFALILLIFNNRENQKLVFELNIAQFMILLLVLFLFIFISQNISYGGNEIILKSTVLNFEKVYFANSNGLGRISAVIALLLFTIAIGKNKINYFIFIISTVFGGIVISYEGKFNIIGLTICLIYIIFNISNKSKNILFILFFFLSTTFYIININYKKYSINTIEQKSLDQQQKISKEQQMAYFKYNSLRIINFHENNDVDLINLIRLNPSYENFKHLIENEAVKKINNLSTGRIYKFIYYSLSNQNYILGTGPMSDRAIAKLDNYAVNNDSASVITYIYLTSGILGLLILFFFYLSTIKIIFNKRTRIMPLNIIFLQSLILLILIRGFFENSFSVWGIDFAVLVLSIITVKNSYNNFNEHNSLKN
jgi:hypothetical protein